MSGFSFRQGQDWNHKLIPDPWRTSSPLCPDLGFRYTQARDFERAAKISFDLARQQMQTGNANVLLLLNAQQTYLQAVIQVVQARANRLSDTAALFQALGGGWWNRAEPPTEMILHADSGKTSTLVDR